MKPLYIFDLDGTLALVDHRRPMVMLMDGSRVSVDGVAGACRGPDPLKPANVWIEFRELFDGVFRLVSKPAASVKFRPDWRGFFRACVDDAPNLPVIRTMQALRLTGADCWIWSGRSDEVRAETEAWLDAQGCLPEMPVRMRPEGNTTPDDTLKRGWLDGMADIDRERLVAVFDDRDKTVRMWREGGVPCFQVAPGGF